MMSFAIFQCKHFILFYFQTLVGEKQLRLGCFQLEYHTLSTIPRCLDTFMR